MIQRLLPGLDSAGRSLEVKTGEREVVRRLIVDLDSATPALGTWLHAAADDVQALAARGPLRVRVERVELKLALGPEIPVCIKAIVEVDAEFTVVELVADSVAFERGISPGFLERYPGFGIVAIDRFSVEGIDWRLAVLLAVPPVLPDEPSVLGSEACRDLGGGLVVDVCGRGFAGFGGRGLSARRKMF